MKARGRKVASRPRHRAIPIPCPTVVERFMDGEGLESISVSMWQEGGDTSWEAFFAAQDRANREIRRALARRAR